MIPSWNCASKNASYAAIAELLEQHGVKTSRARVAEYGRIVLEGGKSRKRRKRAKTAPAANIPATPQSAPAVAAKPAPATPADHGYRRAMSRRHQKKIRHTVHADRTLPT